MYYVTVYENREKIADSDRTLDVPSCLEVNTFPILSRQNAQSFWFLSDCLKS